MGATYTTSISKPPMAAYSRSSENGRTCNSPTKVRSLHSSSSPRLSVFPSSAVSSTGTRPGWSESRQVVLFILLDVMLLCLLVAVSVSLCQHYVNKETTTPGDRDGDGPPLLLEDAPFCLPCREVYLTDEDVKQNVFKVSKRSDEQEGVMLCCGESHDDLSDLVGYMYNRMHYMRDRARGLTTWKEPDSESNAHPDALISHLLLQLNTSGLFAGPKDTKVVPLLSRTTTSQEEKTGGRKATDTDHNDNTTNTTTTTTTRYAAVVRDGSVRIQQGGHYYVYSHLPFKFNSSSSSEQATQFVVRVRGGIELVLLENSVYPCVIAAPRSSCEYSFVGGTFLLEERDELWLMVSHNACVERDKEMNVGVQLM